MRVRLLPADIEFDALPGQTLLQAAEAAGLELPSSCRNGTCRTCICQAHPPQPGAFRHRIEWPGLSADEKREGWLLPCVAEPTAELAIVQPRARRTRSG